MKNTFIVVFIILIVGVVGYFIFTKKETPTLQSEQIVFFTQEECQQETGGDCRFQNCDYIPSGKTMEEVCGKNFKKGWVSAEDIK